jgi:hypothetical protein
MPVSVRSLRSGRASGKVESIWNVLSTSDHRSNPVAHQQPARGGQKVAEDGTNDHCCGREFGETIDP